MKTVAVLIALLLFVGCASRPPRCDRRLTRINARSWTDTTIRHGEP